jgi:hypothetical protein
VRVVEPSNTQLHQRVRRRLGRQPIPSAVLWRDVLETLPHPIAVVDASGRTLAGNRAFRRVGEGNVVHPPAALTVFDEMGMLEDGSTDAPLMVVYPTSIMQSSRN